LRHSRSAPEGPAGSSGTSRTIGRTQDTNRLNGVSWRPYWALRYRSTQLDDSAVATSTRAQLDSFVNGESNFGTNVVVWYAGHFTHDPGHEELARGSDIVGPTLKPDRW
jgi:hypothetical protein